MITPLANSLTAVKKIPENPVIRYHLGMAYYGKGDTEAARAALEKALSLSTNFDGADKAKNILSILNP